jgi:hypothetical protein
VNELTASYAKFVNYLRAPWGSQFIPFNKIDDTLAEQRIGKPHVLERIEPALTGTTPAGLALTELTAPALAAAGASGPD